MSCILSASHPCFSRTYPCGYCKPVSVLSSRYYLFLTHLLSSSRHLFPRSASLCNTQPVAMTLFKRIFLLCDHSWNWFRKKGWGEGDVTSGTTSRKLCTWCFMFLMPNPFFFCAYHGVLLQDPNIPEMVFHHKCRSPIQANLDTISKAA